MNVDTDFNAKYDLDLGFFFYFYCFVGHRLLVGAPRATKLSNQKSQITGGLYNCDVNSASSACQRVNFDNDGKCTLQIKEVLVSAQYKYI